MVCRILEIKLKTGWDFPTIGWPKKSAFMQSQVHEISTTAACSYRRLAAWLPHGLSKSTPVERLARQIQLCAVSGRDTGPGAGEQCHQVCAVSGQDTSPGAGEQCHRVCAVSGRDTSPGAGEQCHQVCAVSGQDTNPDAEEQNHQVCLAEPAVEQLQRMVVC